MGVERVEVPVSGDGGYESPMLYAAGTGNAVTSSGQTHVQGWYFRWNTAEGGFQDTSWWATDVKDGPTAILWNSEEEVKEHITNGGNLNQAFALWQQKIDAADPDDAFAMFLSFGQALQEHGGGGCAFSD